MVVCSRDACLAYAAVLASGGLEELASGACIAWVVQDPVIRIVAHLFSMVERVDVCLVVFLRTQVQEDIWLW